MMNSLGIGVMIPSTTMRPNIPGYPTAATKFVIHSVRPRKREGTRAEPGASASSFGWRYHPANPLRDELALLGDQLSADERRRGECRLRALEPRGFLLQRVRRMVAREHVDSSVKDRPPEGVAGGVRPKRGVHLAASSQVRRGAQQEVVGRGLACRACRPRPGPLSRRHVGDVDARSPTEAGNPFN